MENKYNQIYKKEAPWSFKEPPMQLVELIKSGIIKKGAKVLDIGSGEGHYAVYLAQQGFDVIGIDSSVEAINLANKNKPSNLKLQFILMDYKELKKLNKKFDFILEWRFLHLLINDKERKDYVKLIHEVLEDNGIYLSVSFNINSKAFGTGKLRTPSDTKTPLYFASEEEIKELFSNFKVMNEKLIDLPERNNNHLIGSCFLLRK
jgi:cyclopropane fatty-acyl-phospholipid synthase-like methyltransferase